MLDLGFKSRQIGFAKSTHPSYPPGTEMHLEGSGHGRESRDLCFKAPDFLTGPTDIGPKPLAPAPQYLPSSSLGYGVKKDEEKIDSARQVLDDHEVAWKHHVEGLAPLSFCLRSHTTVVDTTSHEHVCNHL